MIAYSSGNRRRRLALPERIATWSLVSLQHVVGVREIKMEVTADVLPYQEVIDR